MYEKEAEEYADKNKTRGGSSSFGDITNYHDLREGFIAGAEFGYNKANGGHYVKKELPPEDVPLLCVRGGNIYVAWLILGKWKGDKYNDVKKPYAWKEIVLPKESE